MYKVKDEYKDCKFHGLLGGQLVVKKLGEFTQAQLKQLAEEHTAQADEFLTVEQKKEATPTDKG